jgi:hypothetical protein
MNELQIKLTADIKDIQSALTKVKKTLKEFEDSASSSTDKTNKKKSDQVGIIQKLNAELSKYKTLITKATSEAEIAKYNAELQKTQKELARLNALGKVFEQRKVVVKEEIGLIGQLNAQVKQLKVSLQQATSEKEVARLNAELEKTSAELARINSLGKTVTAPAVKSFDNLKRAQGAATSSAIAFGRIIQDAPFGIMGVANNIQNFGEQFAALGGKATTAGAKLKMFFSALIQPTSLAILGISALTAGWQAYSMGLFDAEEETADLRTESEKLNDSLNTLKSNLSDVDSARLKGNQSAADELVKFKLLKQAIEDVKKPNDERIKAFETLKKLYPEIIGSMTSEEALAGKLSTAYNKINESIRDRAKAQGIYEVLVEIEKESAELQLQTIKQGLFKNKLLADEARLQKEVADLTDLVNRNNARGNTTQSAFNESLRNAQAELAGVQSELSLLNNVVAPGTTKALNENEFAAAQLEDQFKKTASATDIFIEKSKKLKKDIGRVPEVIPDIKLDRPVVKNVKGVDIPDLKIEPDLEIQGNEGFIQQIQARIEAITKLRDESRNLAEIFAFNLQLGALQNQLASLNGEEVKSNLELITEAFGSLGAGIASSLNISNRALRGFVTTLISATPKIVSAIMAQADANMVGAGKNILADKKESLSGGIKLGVKAAEALGPVGLALLPVFIAGAVALISGAFSKVGGGGASPSVSAGSGSTFANRREFGGPVSKGRAYIVGEKRPELFVPNTNGVIVPQVPSMDYSGTSMSAGAMAIDVNIHGVSYGDDILFTVQQAQIRRGIR